MPYDIDGSYYTDLSDMNENEYRNYEAQKEAVREDKRNKIKQEYAAQQKNSVTSPYSQFFDSYDDDCLY